MKNAKNLTVGAIQCEKCLDIVFSRNRHDMRYCSCGLVAIDGGRDYTKVSFQGEIGPRMIELELIGISNFDLFVDWNRSEEKFGIIKTKSLVDGGDFRYTFNKAGRLRHYLKS